MSSRDRTGGRRGTPTQRGFAPVTEDYARARELTPIVEEATEVDPPAPATAPAASATPPSEPDFDPRRSPPLHVEVVYIEGAASVLDGPWRAVEIWTRNRIYVLDQSLVCLDVVDLASRRSNPEHPFIGARLVGGQRRDGHRNELSHPYPVPGSEAVFERFTSRRPRLSQTSTVTRVVLRLRVISVIPDRIASAWEDITGSHRVK